MFPLFRHAILLSIAIPFIHRLGGTEPAYGMIEEDFDQLEENFRTLPMDSRRLTGPLFWLHGEESPELLHHYVEKIAEGGNGTFVAESRPHNDWLGEGWYRDLAICLEAAKKHDLEMWIFDEQWWPSQSIAGKVPPEYAAKRLVAEPKDVPGGMTFTAENFEGPRYIGAVAGHLNDAGAVEAQSLEDLAPFIEHGRLSWPAPAGRWRVIRFTHEQAPPLAQGNKGHLSVDGASKDCVDWFIKTVYAPHYDRFKDDFGRTIAGYFYDEPETLGDWGTELNAVLAERGLDWKTVYVAYKDRLAAGDQTAARYAYLSAFAETWGRTMYGGLQAWCNERGVESIGHFMEHRGLHMRPEFCAGDMMALQKYSSMGGIDAVWTQFDWNNRVGKDAPVWQTPKLGSSITHAYGRPHDISMVEIFGARGQDITYPEMKWWTDHMQVSGVNFMVPHSFNPKSPADTDCPPYFYMNGHEPRWPLYRVYADYTSRLSILLTGGHHLAPVALLTPGQSAHVGTAIPAEALSESLQDALYDCDWLPYEVFENDMVVDGRTLRLRDETYRVLVVPAAEVIPYATLAKAKEFLDRGGVVVGYGMLPAVSATLGKSAQDIAELRDAIWGDATPGPGVCQTGTAGGRSYFLPENPSPEQLRKVLAGDAKIRPTLEVLDGETDHNLHVLHRVRNGRDLFFVTNQNHTGDARDFRFRVTAPGIPECWDAMRNEITNVPFERKGDAVEIPMTLQPNESVLLVFQDQARPLPVRGRRNGPAIAIQRHARPPGNVESKDEGLHLTRSPVEADPFLGTCEIPATVDLAKSRVYLQCDTLAPEEAARITVNGVYAGGFLSRPFQLDVTKHLRDGSNTIAIEPFAPENARLVIEKL